MKPIKFLWLACLCILLTASQCKKDKDPVSQLPPETQSGANTFGCLVDGKAWVPSGTDYASGTNVTANYMYMYPGPVGYALIIRAHDYNGNPTSFFNIGMDSMKLSTGMVIELTNKKGEGGATYSRNDANFNYITYYVSDSLTGKLKISRLDEANQIISGVFGFDAINRFGEKVHITEGRFDVKYTI